MNFKNQESTLIRDLYVSRNNLIKYLKIQNYNTTDYESFTINEINAMNQGNDITSQLNFEIEHNEDPERKCSIIYMLKSSIKQSTLENTVLDYYEENDSNKCTLVIVTLNTINDSVQKVIKQLWKKYNEYVAIFDIPGLLFNILEHSFVPKHTKLNDEEKKEIYSKFNIKDDSQVPEISIFDPVAKTMLLRPGELCEIIRHDKISFENKFYRVCVI